MLRILRQFQTIHGNIIQAQLQIRFIKKYLKKDIYFQKKEKKIMDELRLK